MDQRIITSEDNYKALDRWIKESGIRKLMLVCDDSIKFQKELGEHIDGIGDSIGVEVLTFSDFKPNPLYESVVDGVGLYRSEGCDGIMAVGGGSAMDVAKCIKLYSNVEGDGHDGGFLNREYTDSGIPFLAVPTTAGTGSEATRYAVVYYEGKKQSITSSTFIPDTVLMDPNCLVTLPLYQKKATMMDAFCHAIESYWSVNSTDESKEYCRQALELILENIDEYLADDNSEECRRKMLLAANLAGKAINITQTTAGHAMCYKLTSLFNVAHGHAAILCDRVLFPWMIDNTDKCIDKRGSQYLKQVLDEIGHAMGCKNASEGAKKLDSIFNILELAVPTASPEQYMELKTSVNPDRLKNHPISLDEDTIDGLYHMICNS